MLGGRGHEACGDAACLNAAAVLYVAGQAADLGDGLAQAREAVESGAALEKLEEWVAAQAGGVGQRAAGEARLRRCRRGPACDLTASGGARRVGRRPPLTAARRGPPIDAPDAAAVALPGISQLQGSRCKAGAAPQL